MNHTFPFGRRCRSAIGLLLLMQAFHAGGADCVRDTREVAIRSESGGSGVRMRHYLCDKPGVGQISVEFNRLNDLAAGLMLAGRGPDAFRQEFQNTKLVRNEVLDEFNRLVKAYGDSETQQTAYLGASSSIGDSGSVGVQLMQEIRVLVPGQADARSTDFPDPAALSNLINYTTVPPRYTAVQPPYDTIALIWRYMDMDDVRQYPSRLQEYNKLILSQKFEGQYRGVNVGYVDRYIRLYRELADGGLPNDFVTIFGERDIGPQCGYRKYWQFQYHPRELIVDFAVIQNKSQNPVTINGLIGVVTGGRMLRPPATGLPKANEQQPISFGQPVRLEPNQRLAVATRLTWVVRDQFRQLFAAEKKNAPSGKPYAWGTEWRISGVQVESQPLNLEGGAANFLAVTTSCECGSCPYLYAWRESGGGWRNTGKIIDKAIGEEHQMSETRRFDGLVTRFKLIEHEAEVARIDQVSLQIELGSGRTLTLQPSEHAVQHVDGNYLNLAMGDAAEFRFALPPDLHGEKVKESRLTVTGYYDRYNDILARRFGDPQPLAIVPSRTFPNQLAMVIRGEPTQACVRPAR